MIHVNDDVVEVVRPEGAVLASLFPLRRKHEVVDDELAPLAEEIGERLLAVRAVEDIRRGDLLPRQLAPLPAEVIAETGEFLLLFQMRRARGNPRFMRDDRVVLDICA